MTMLRPSKSQRNSATTSHRDSNVSADGGTRPLTNEQFVGLIKTGYERAREALRETAAAQASPKSQADGQALSGLDESAGWRWHALETMHGLALDIAPSYESARDKFAAQYWESLVGPVFTGVGAASGAALTALGASVKAAWGDPVIAVGFLLAVGGSVFSANAYVRSRKTQSRYLRLVFDMSDYSFMVLPTASPGDVFQQLDTFRGLWETAGS